LISIPQHTALVAVGDGESCVCRATNDKGPFKVPAQQIALIYRRLLYMKKSSKLSETAHVNSNQKEDVVLVLKI